MTEAEAVETAAEIGETLRHRLETLNRQIAALRADRDNLAEAWRTWNLDALKYHLSMYQNIELRAALDSLSLSE